MCSYVILKQEKCPCLNMHRSMNDLYLAL